MSVQVAVQTVQGAPVLALSGVADERLLVRLASGVRAVAEEATELVVLDVRELVLTDVNAVRAFLSHLLDGDPAEKIVFACDRLSGRRMLRRFGGDAVRVFPTPWDAVGAPVRAS